MKRTFFHLALMAGIFAGVIAPACYADEDATPKTTKKVKKNKKDDDDDADKGNLPAVKAAIADIEFLEGEPSKKAKYYVYLHSASWCGPCKALMPSIVKEYKKMQKKKIEIILIGHDKTEEAAKAYLEHYDAGFPCVLSTSAAASSLPGYTSPSGIPYATIVDEDGNVLYNDHAKGVLEWKKICKPNKSKKK